MSKSLNDNWMAYNGFTLGGHHPHGATMFWIHEDFLTTRPWSTSTEYMIQSLSTLKHLPIKRWKQSWKIPEMFNHFLPQLGNYDHGLFWEDALEDVLTFPSPCHKSLGHGGVESSQDKNSWYFLPKKLGHDHWLISWTCEALKYSVSLKLGSPSIHMRVLVAIPSQSKSES